MNETKPVIVGLFDAESLKTLVEIVDMSGITLMRLKNRSSSGIRDTTARAGERIRAVHLRITSATPGDPPHSVESPKAQNPVKPRFLRPRRPSKTPDGGERAPRVPQRSPLLFLTRVPGSEKGLTRIYTLLTDTLIT